MSSRPGSGSNSRRQRSRESQEDFPPLPPAPMLPSIQILNTPRDRESASNRPQPRHWSAASLRAERIRNLDQRASTSLDDFDSSIDQIWYPSSRRIARIRNPPDPRLPSADPDRSMGEARLRALLDLTASYHPYQQSLLAPLRSRDFSDDNRRSKRRKLDADRLTSGFKAFRYGKYGQVEPGQLRMEIVSCDGGMFSDKPSYAADNILRSDNSVYCTKSNRCNIVLRHEGATIFTLQELIIKAPGSMNYSHPVREGMVFVAMEQDDMLSRTVQYQIQYGPTSRERSSRGDGDNRLVFEREPRHVVSIRHHDDGSTTTRAGRIYRPDDDDDRVPQMPDEFTAILADFRVTTECSDEVDDGAYDAPLFRAAPDRIGSLPFETADSDSDETSNPMAYEQYADSLLLHESRRHMLERERERDPDHPSLAEAIDAHTNATQEAVRAVGGGELLSPHARFFIEKKKSKCTIKFDPPVSGRFILLKMWSSHHDGGNIDIQSVIARGFAGPRYFPSVELR